MPKSSIIRELANNEITLDLAFNNLLLVASVINNKELLKWVEREISGYAENDNLPIYRKSEKSLQFVYSGISGNYPINNSPMPFTYFSEEVQNTVINFKIYEGIKIIERQLALKDEEWSLVRDCTQYANDVYMKTGIQCFSIGQVLQKSHYEKVYNTIKFTLTKILLMIEKWFGTLDTSELETKRYEKQRIFEASKDISSYIIGLHDAKTAIPNPRITIPNGKDAPAPQAAKQQAAAPQMPQQPPVPQQMQQPPQMPQQPVIQPQMQPQYQPQMAPPPQYQPQMQPQYQPQMAPPPQQIIPSMMPQQMQAMPPQQVVSQPIVAPPVVPVPKQKLAEAVPEPAAASLNTPVIVPENQSTLVNVPQTEKPETAKAPEAAPKEPADRAQSESQAKTEEKKD